MDCAQPGILGPVPRAARYVFLSQRQDADLTRTLTDLAQLADGDRLVVGIGGAVLDALGVEVPGMRTLPARESKGVSIPSTPFSLWCWLRGDNRGELVHKTHELRRLVDGHFHVERVVDAFMYGASLDLTGYEDGTENPEGDEAVSVATTTGSGPGLDGSSYVAVQQWIHDLDHFKSLSQDEQDHTIGRRLSDNEEIDDAPESAHVKRTAQETFDPEAFVVRRSMPRADASREGLVFVAFGRSFDAFESLLSRMVGEEDGIVDALFGFTRPVTGSYFWCPPVADGHLDLSALGL